MFLKKLYWLALVFARVQHWKGQLLNFIIMVSSNESLVGGLALLNIFFYSLRVCVVSSASVFAAQNHVLRPHILQAS